MIKFKSKNSRNLPSETGQVLLIIVLVTIVILTVGLSLISRSITNIKTSTEEVNSQKALAAAEAGIEQSLKSQKSIDIPIIQLDPNTTYQTTVATVSGKEFLIQGGETIQRDDSADIWLSNYSENPSQLYSNPTSAEFTLYWGSSADKCKDGALEVEIVSGLKTNPVLNRYVYDPCDQRTATNNFFPAVRGGTTVKGIFFTNKISEIEFTNGLFIRVTPIYADTKIAIKSSRDLPPQGIQIDATGISGETTRKVSVFQGYPEIPSEFFPYSIFSPGS